MLGEDPNQPIIDSEQNLISIIAANKPGMLAAFTSTISDYGYNIESLTISANDVKNTVHRTTAYVSGRRTMVDELCEALREINDVYKVLNFTADAYIERELCLVKAVITGNDKIGDLTMVASQFNASTIYAQDEVIIFQFTNEQEKVTEFLDRMSKVCSVELLRSGIIATSIDPVITDY